MPSVETIRLGDNAVYLLELAGSRVLIDTGPDFRGAAATLQSALGGRLPEAVIATHGHLDHAGLGAWWQERGVPVVLFEADHSLATGQAPGDAEFDGLIRYARESGAPPPVVAEAVEAVERRRAWTRAARAADGYLPSRDRRWPTGLRYRPFTPVSPAQVQLPDELQLLPCPGHTPGNAVAWVPAEGWLFSGDQLLPGLTPTPALQAAPPGTGPDWRYRSFPAFLRSLARVRALHPSRCFPGHGEPFDDVDAVIGRDLDQAEQRLERTREALERIGPAPVYRIAEELYPRAAARRFWQLVATVQGLLDELERRGLAARCSDGWVAAQAARKAVS